MVASTEVDSATPQTLSRVRSGRYSIRMRTPSRATTETTTAREAWAVTTSVAIRMGLEIDLGVTPPNLISNGNIVMSQYAN